MPIQLHDHGFAGAVNSHTALRKMAQFQARVALDAVTLLTDNIGGTASPTNTVTAIAETAVNVAASGSSLAGKASADPALLTVTAALSELIAKANAAGAKLGFTALTDNTGGAAADGTAGVITVAVTGATTGLVAADVNAFVDGVNSATHKVAALVSKVATATGVAPLKLVGFNEVYSNTVAVIDVTTGAAADPGVTKVDLDAKLAAMQVNLKTISTVLAAALAGPGNAEVVAV